MSSISHRSPTIRATRRPSPTTPPARSPRSPVGRVRAVAALQLVQADRRAVLARAQRVHRPGHGRPAADGADLELQLHRRLADLGAARRPRRPSARGTPTRRGRTSRPPCSTPGRRSTGAWMRGQAAPPSTRCWPTKACTTRTYSNVALGAARAAARVDRDSAGSTEPRPTCSFRPAWPAAPATWPAAT